MKLTQHEIINVIFCSQKHHFYYLRIHFDTVMISKYVIFTILGAKIERVMSREQY